MVFCSPGSIVADAALSQGFNNEFKVLALSMIPHVNLPYQCWYERKNKEMIAMRPS
jgi:hypothetical protein